LSNANTPAARPLDKGETLENENAGLHLSFSRSQVELTKSGIVVMQLLLMGKNMGNSIWEESNLFILQKVRLVGKMT